MATSEDFPQIPKVMYGGREPLAPACVRNLPILQILALSTVLDSKVS